MQNFLRLTNITKEDYTPLYLVPGLGSQSGKIEDFAVSKVNFKRCLFSLSRALLFPQEKETRHKNSNSQRIAQQQKEQAHFRFWKEQINNYRK